MILRLVLIVLLMVGWVFPVNATSEAVGCASQRIISPLDGDVNQACVPCPVKIESGCATKAIAANASLTISPERKTEPTNVARDFPLVSDLKHGIDRPPKSFLS